MNITTKMPAQTSKLDYLKHQLTNRKILYLRTRH